MWIDLGQLKPEPRVIGLASPDLAELGPEGFGLVALDFVGMTHRRRNGL